MKSFADWTDEIHDLMNPPKPMVDRCNWTHDELSFYEGDQWPAAVTGRWKTEAEIGLEMRKPVDFSKYLQDWPAVPAGDATGAGIYAELKQRLAAVGTGRRTGKSWMQRQMMEALAKHGEVFYEVTPTGRIKYDGNELLKRGIINTPRGLKQMVHFSNPGNPFVYDGYATFTQEDWDKL